MFYRLSQFARKLHAHPLDDPAELPEMIAGIARAGDQVICLGAGSITGWAQALPDQLAARLGGGKGRIGGSA